MYNLFITVKHSIVLSMVLIIRLLLSEFVEILQRYQVHKRYIYCCVFALIDAFSALQWKNYWVLFHWKWLLWVWWPIIAFQQKTIPILLTPFKKFLFIQFFVTFVIFGTTHLYSHTFHVFVVLVHSCFNGKLCHEYIIRFEIMRIDSLKTLLCANFLYNIEQIIA